MQSNKLRIFVSYAHDDDAVLLDGHNKGWVSQLIDKLNIVLKQKMGGQIRFDIWQDQKKLSGNNELNQSIYDALDEADIFIMILSPCYLNSSWCKKELNYFVEKMPIKDITRIFVIEKDKINRKDLPDCIKVASPFPFITSGGSV
jgi:hypothetical protein